MRNYRKLLGISAVIVIAFGSAYSNLLQADGKSKATMSGYERLTQMANAMGGLDSILNLDTISFDATGSRFEPEQAYKPGGDFIDLSDYQYQIIKSVTSQQSRTQWSHNVFYVFPGIRDYIEIINEEQGAIIGNALLFGPPEMPMLSTRLGAQVKQYTVSSVLSLIHRANQNPTQVMNLGKAEYNDRKQYVVAIPGWGQVIRVFIDKETYLPSKIETLEDDSTYGDTRWEISLSDWVVANGIQVPTTLVHRINKRLINIEHRTSYNLAVMPDASLYAIPAELMSEYNTDQFAWGMRSSQWFNRYLPIGIPFDIDQRTAATLDIVEVAPKLFHATGPTHHSMIIEMDEYLIVVEPPLYEERSIVVINAIKQQWPAKPIKYLLVTHFHTDHIGGIRAYGAIGATLIVGSQTKDHYEAIFKAHHKVFPDSYQMQPVDITIVEVEAGNDMVISDANRKVRIFDLANVHAIGTLIPFVEDANAVFTSDLFSPGFFPDTIPEPFLSWSGNLLTGLEASGLDIQMIVGGHGGVGTYSDFAAQVRALQ